MSNQDEKSEKTKEKSSFEAKEIKTKEKQSKEEIINISNNKISERTRRQIEKQNKYKKTVDENISSLKKLIILDIVFAILSSMFFAGYSKTGYISLFIYTFFLSVASYLFLTKEGLVKCKKAFIWLLPINLIAFSNAMFTTNSHGFNVFVIHFMLTVMYIQVTNISFSSVFDFTLLFKVFDSYIPNLEFVGTIFQKTQSNDNDKSNKKHNYINVLIGLAVTIPFLAIIISLLSEADKNFSNVIEDTLGRVLDMFVVNTYTFENFMYFIFMSIVFVLVTTKMFWAKDDEHTELKKFNINVVTINTFLICLNVVYILFLLLQTKYVITDGPLTLPHGFQYSEYAKDGFYPTFDVTIINFFIFLFLVGFSEIDFKNKMFRTNFFVLFISNTLLIVNALSRMYIYIVEYGFTTQRQMATFGLLLELILMVLLLLMVTKNINFYKYAVIAIVSVFVVQNYVCNDYVNTYLNFKKFNVTTEDVKETLKIQDDTYAITLEDHTLTFPRNVDALAYMSNVYEDVVTESSYYLSYEYNMYRQAYIDIDKMYDRNGMQTEEMKKYNRPLTDNEVKHYIDFMKEPIYNKTIIGLILEDEIQ